MMLASERSGSLSAAEAVTGSVVRIIIANKVKMFLFICEFDSNGCCCIWLIAVSVCGDRRHGAAVSMEECVVTGRLPD